MQLWSDFIYKIVHNELKFDPFFDYFPDVMYILIVQKESARHYIVPSSFNGALELH